MHHYVGDAGRMPRTGEENAGVRVHHCLVGGYGSIEFPHYDAFGVIEEVVTDAWNRSDDGYVERC